MKVFVTRAIPNVAIELLEQHAEVTVFDGDLPPSRDELLAGSANANGMISMLSDSIDSELFDRSPNLKVVSNFAVGFNNIDVVAASDRKVAIGNTPEVLTDATADLAVGLLLAGARRFAEGEAAVRQGGWRTWEPLGWIGHSLAGKTIGIVGMGRIGHAVAKRLHGGWGMKVLYTARTPKPAAEKELSAKHVELAELLATSDFVSLHVPLTEQTRQLISDEQFAQMKPECILVNTARGEVIDQEALHRALLEGEIFAAALDVCTPEPLPTDHPLLDLQNCLLLPHIGSATVDAREAMAERAAQNVIAGLQGAQLPFPVN